MSGLEEFKATYFQECAELLEAMEQGLMAIDSGESAKDHIDSIFRAVHSVKGGAGAFNFDQLVTFAHVFETVLDHIRHGKLEPSSDVIEVMLRAGDILADLVAMAREGEAVPPDLGAEVLAALTAFANKGTGEGADEAEDKEAAPADFDEIEFTPVTAEQLAESFEEKPRRFEIAFRPHPKLYRSANEPQILFRELRSLGALKVDVDTASLPELAKIDSDGAYFGWTLTLDTTRPRSEVEQIFEFVVGDCDLDIAELGDGADAGSTADGPPKPAETPPAPPPARAGDSGGAGEHDASRPPPAEGETAEAKGAPPADAAKAERAGGKEKESAAAPTLRVEIGRVDRVVNTVGELVITQAMLMQLVQKLPPESAHAALSRSLEQLSHVTRELQECAMAMRTQPVRSVFQRLPRLVREVSSKTSKRVRLVMDGEGTEVDKTVTERLSDPLTHMVRNAIDHGIEAPDERIAARKPPEGTIRLSAEHRGGRIIIELSDDGRGINRQRVREKAIASNLIAADAKLSDEEIDNLVFLPGFSTATQVSDISGRGVGMDVVRRNVEAIGGRVTIRSVPGQGSTFRMTLPLTLAVMEGMVVAVGEEIFILPLANIVECLRLNAKEIKTAAMGGQFLMLRGEVIPLVYLWQFFKIAGARTKAEEGVVLVIEIEGGGKLGLVVDQIRGQQQVVVKTLEANYGRIEGVAAATVMGDGQVALIIDVDAFARLVSTGRSSGQSASTRIAV